MSTELPIDPTQRFSDRVENYRKYRPSYPAALYEYLREEAGLRANDFVADIGSGTGLLSMLFLDRGHEVFGIEPNDAMRSGAEEIFADRPNFHSVNGRAEAIPLPYASVDFVVVGQAFHWFDPAATKAEVRRILRSDCQAALIWNNRRLESNAFQHDYELLLEKFGVDYSQVSRRWVITDEGLADWFAPNPMKQANFPNAKRVDWEGLRGGLLSASYAPNESHPNYEPMMSALRDLFERHQIGGFIDIQYRTKVYHGAVS
jgi:SAM-dependent methyltransferase